MWFWIALLSGFLCLVVVQDFRLRSIHVILPFAIFGFSVLAVGLTRSLLFQTLANIVYVVLAVGIMVAYVSIRRKAFQNPFATYFGLGDLLFFMAVTPLFQLVNYILFFIFSMVFAILMQQLFKKRIQASEIPLAGFSALLLLLVICADTLRISHYPLTLL